MNRLIAVLGTAALAGIGLTACGNTTNVTCLDRQAYVVPLDDEPAAVPEKGVAPRPPAPKAPVAKSGSVSGRSTTTGGKAPTSTIRTPTQRFTSTAPRTYSTSSARTNTYYITHFYDNVHYSIHVNPYLPLRPYYIGWGYYGYHPFSTYSYLYGWGDGYLAGSMSNNQC